MPKYKYKTDRQFDNKPLSEIPEEYYPLLLELNYIIIEDEDSQHIQLDNRPEQPDDSARKRGRNKQ